jgi:hypothetical protein
MKQLELGRKISKLLLSRLPKGPRRIASEGVLDGVRA